MKPKFAHDSFGRLPTFEAALRSPFHDQKFLLRIGEEICRCSLENIIGVGLLHRHFPIRDNEYLIRMQFSEVCFTYVTSHPPRGAQPCCWIIDSESRQPLPLEYLITPNPESVLPPASDLLQLASLIAENGLCYTYGLVYLPAQPRNSSSILYELTDERIRLSMVSGWRDPEHSDDAFAQSVYCFQNDNGTVKKIGCNRCKNCPSCENAIPAIPKRLRRNVRRNLFGLELDIEYREFDLDLVTPDILKTLHHRLQDKLLNRVS